MSASGARALIDSIKRPRTVVRICLDGDLLAEHAELTLQLQALDHATTSLAGDPEAQALAERITQVEAAMPAATHTFALQAMPRSEWMRLVAEHPSESDADAVDLESFAVPVVAASLTDPAMSVAEAGELRDALSAGQWSALWEAAYAINQAEATSVPFSERASVLMRMRAPK